MKSLRVSVIISTYNQPIWLEKVLCGYACQSVKDFEIIIADDGSNEETKKMIERFSNQVPFSIKHVWHPDEGFRKTIILNKAIKYSETDYLLFTDGDCIPRKDFIATHLHYRQKGYFLSGGYFKLPKLISDIITSEDIESQRCFNINWLKNKGIQSSFKLSKLTVSGINQKFLNFITPTKASWNGMNSSGWKKDIIAVNGFDERMQYGGEDREMGERLFNFGIKSKQIRYSAVCIHLYHERGYVKTEMMENNEAIRAITINKKVIVTPYGLNKI